MALGKWAFNESSSGQNVTLSQNSSGTVVADAVKAVRDNSGDTNTAHHDFSYSYDPNGNLTAITDSSPGATVTSYGVSYDQLNRVTQVLEQNSSGSTVHTTGYGYDAAGNITSRTHDSAPSSYVYDPRNLLTKETDAASSSDPSPKVTTFSYTPDARLGNEVKANGNTVAYSYYADGLLQSQTEKTSGGTLVSSHSYSYDPNNNKTQDIQQLMSADNNGTDLSHTYTYSYDPRDRIATVAKDGTSTESYAHDANDNVTSQTINGTTTTYNYDRNRLLTAVTGSSTAAYNYDPFGRVDTVSVDGSVWERNTYDGFDHIIQHQQFDTSAPGWMADTNYTYDPLDRKASQTTCANCSNPKTTNYQYLGLSNQLVSELVNGTVSKSYDYTPGGTRLDQVTHNSDGTTTPGYYSYNSHSDVEAVTGTDGKSKATYGYTAYGQADTSMTTGADKNNTNPSSTTTPYNSYRFNAMRWDSASGQYDMGFRNYGPSLNQFLSRDMYNGALADMKLDTDAFTGNRYTFGAGNPISNIELDGHSFPPNGGGTGGGQGSSPSQCAGNITACLYEYYGSHGGQFNSQGIPTGRGYVPPASPTQDNIWGGITLSIVFGAGSELEKLTNPDKTPLFSGYVPRNLEGLMERESAIQYNDVLQAFAQFYRESGDPIRGNYLFERYQMGNGLYKNVVFVAGRSKLPPALRNTLEDMGIEAYRLPGFHTELAAARYLQTMSKMPAGQRVASVSDFLSLRGVCSKLCSLAAKIATGGRDVSVGSNGFSSIPQVEQRIDTQRSEGANDPEAMLQSIAETYEESMLMDEPGD